MAAVEGAPVEREVGGGLEKFKMLQDVAVNESQKDARLQGCTQWSLCKEEMLEEKTEPASLAKGSVL
ncbi:hypothetical protein MUG91_G113n49 [Manis pentadactyla]|nr:hypothetical protein MUG91_G113n49 [Manis pentadactyla]